MKTKLSNELFDEWLTEQQPFNQEKWTNLLNAWLRPKTTKQLWVNLDFRAKCLVLQSITNEFIDYPLNLDDDSDFESPIKIAMKYFRTWLRHLDWQINFLSGNRPWCSALESLTGMFKGSCFVKKHKNGKSYGGLFQLDKKGVIIMVDNGRPELYKNALEAVLVGGWSPD